ncbi:dCTP deaminase [Pleomorphomonas sp. PLEO]|uniref:dCTP deaminase n=1 Tax=Pleomorphomonas sp. PLEO TaxID=3239306 RepID=UPI00351E06E5
MLDCVKLADLIALGNRAEPDGLAIIPEPNIEEIRSSGESSISLRLGRWFLALRQSSQPFFDSLNENEYKKTESKASKYYYVPFGQEFVLHPGRFVLGATLEWLKFPTSYGGYVGGKSSLARRGLIIETAAGIHPGFNGCLTLELANVGEVPIKIRPGMKICQIFIHNVWEGSKLSSSLLDGRRRPYLGFLKEDDVLIKLTERAKDVPSAE